MHAYTQCTMAVKYIYKQCIMMRVDVDDGGTSDRRRRRRICY